MASLSGRAVQVVAAIALLGAISTAAWSCVWTVDQTEQGVVLRFGRAARIVPAGFHLTLPWPIERMERLVVSEVQRMTVGYRLGSTVEPADDEVQWLTGDTNIAELRALITFTREDPARYLFAVADPSREAGGDGTAAEFVPKERLIRMAAEAALTSLLSRMTIDDVLSTGKAVLQRETHDRAQEMLDALDSGVRITAVDIVEASPPRDVNSAFQDVQSAKADRERRITEARGERNRTMPRTRADADRLLREAETYRTEVLNRAKGEASRFASVQMEIARNPEVARTRIWLEAVREALPWCDVKVISRSAGRPVRIYLEEGPRGP